jgi:hypothetical protein
VIILAKNQISMKAKTIIRNFRKIGLLLVLYTTASYGQVGFSIRLPFCKFYGEGIDNTSYIVGINPNFQYYIPLNVSGKSLLLCEAGYGVSIGTKQEYEGETYKARISGLDLGFFYKQYLTEAKLSPYLLGGVNLQALMADHPQLAIDNGVKIEIKSFQHPVLFPELSLGAGFSWGIVSFEIRDNIGLMPIDNGKSVKSNVISLNIMMTRANIGTN